MKRYFVKATLLTIATVGLSTTAANAYTTGDFVLGFRQAGNSTDVAGSVTLSNFTSTQTFDLGNVGSNFATVFGSGWATDSTVQWAVGATNGSNGGSGTINYISSPETVGGSEAATQTGFASTSSGTIQSRINAAGNGTQAPFTTTAIGLGIVGTQDLGSNAQAWQRYMDGGSVAGSGGDWGFYNASKNTEANFGNGVAGQTLDVWQVPVGAGAAGTDLGDFSLLYNAANGDLKLKFTPDSFEQVPEPSTYALLAIGAIGVFSTFIRRRRA